MRNAPEVVREIGVDDVRVTPEQPLLHLYDCLLGISPGPVGVDFRRKIGFEDRFQHHQRCCHADPIPHARDAQRSEFAVGLRYIHSSDWVPPSTELIAAMMKYNEELTKAGVLLAGEGLQPSSKGIPATAGSWRCAG